MFVLPDYCKNAETKEIAQKLLDHVISKNTVITYGELCKQLSFPMNPRNIEGYLGNISFACKENGLLPISVMVVNSDTMIPGAGFFKAYYPNVKKDEERLVKGIELINEVIRYSNWKEVLDAFSI